MAIVAGTRFGPYVVAEQIGAGGMGEVYRAKDTTLEREVAIKVLPQTFASDAGRVARFAQEAKTLAALNHAHIAQIYGLEKAGDTTVIVMELVDGPTLADRIAQGPIPPDDALSISLQIVAALEAAHGQRIVHRDLKPANVKLRTDGTVKVLDFGIAKALEPSATSGGQSPVMTTPVTQAGVLLGTAAYMSPEQARGKPVDERTDIWAFGCLLYEMLTGQPAFGGEDVPLTLARVLAHDTDMTTLPGMISPAVRQTLRLCLQKDPKKRVADIRDVRLALTGAFDTVSYVEAGASAHAFWQRPVVVAAGALLVGALLAGGAAWYLWPATEPAIVTRFDIDVPLEQAFRNTGRPVIALSRDGRYLAYNTINGLYLRAMDDVEARPLPGTEPGLANPFFSHDGEWIGYWDIGSEQLKKIRTTGGSPVTVAATAVPYGAVWSANGYIIYGQRDGISRVSASGGDPETIIAADGELLVGPQVLPDESILYTVFRPGGTVGTVCVQTPGLGDRTELFTSDIAIYLPTGHLVSSEELPGSASTGSTLFVRSFDLNTRTTGGPIPIQEGVWYAGANSQFAVSPSGTLAFAMGVTVGGADTVLALVDRHGAVERLNVEPNQYRGPRVSPDGTQVAVEIIGANGRSSIGIYDLSGARAFRPLLGAGSNMRPLWTPDGKRLTYASDRDGTWGIYSQAVEGSAVAERITRAEPGVEHWPDSWSADARTLAFTRIAGTLDSIGSQGIWTVTLDENGRPGEPQAFLAEGAGGAAFSPQGKWIAYRENTTDGAQIHVQPYPPTGEVHPVTDEGGAYPTWSWDGDELLYRRPTGGANTLLTLGSIEVTSGASFAWGKETTLSIPGGIAFFGFRDFDLLPDENHIVTAVASDSSAVAGSSGTGLSIQVVANWFELVKESVPAR
jgi:hypothetical protein